MNNLNRRRFVKSAAGLGLATMTGFAGAFNAFGAAKNINALGKINNIGLQLYTVRGMMRKNLEQTIQQVAEVGYQEVEFAGYYKRSASDIKNILDQSGLKSPSAHIDLNLMQGDVLKKTLEYSNIVGHKYIIIPYLQEQERQTLDQYKALAALFNEIGEHCKAADIQLAYHNHNFEFQMIDGVIPYDILLNETDGDLVKMQMDLFWIINGGGEPLDYFKRFPGRFPLCHVKDMKKGGTMVAVGDGDIDFAALFSFSEQAGLEHYIVEHDKPDDPLESIKKSFDTLKNMTVV